MSEQPWGRVDEDGTVWVRTADGERSVGSYPDATHDEALAYFTRKYDDLAAQVSLLEQRIDAGQLNHHDAQGTIDRLTPTISDANAVGDLAGLLSRLEALGPKLEALKEAAEAAKAEAKAQALLERTVLVEEAEKLSNEDPARIPWRTSGDRLKELFDQWKVAQRKTRLDKAHEDELWKRFSHARTQFDRKRRQYFSSLDAQRTATKSIKEDLVDQAESMVESTDWNRTASAFKNLMSQWKAAGRAGRKDEDALWNRFKGAQDQFFAARNAAMAIENEEFTANLAVKEQILAQAEALLPITDVKAAKQAMRPLQEQWDRAGKVPRNDMQRVEGRMRAVETAIRNAEQDTWKRTNPEAQARANNLVEQLEKSLTDLNQQLEKAQAAKNDKKVASLTADIAAKQEWLEQANKALNEFSG